MNTWNGILLPVFLLFLLFGGTNVHIATIMTAYGRKKTLRPIICINVCHHVVRNGHNVAYLMLGWLSGLYWQHVLNVTVTQCIRAMSPHRFIHNVHNPLPLYMIHKFVQISAFLTLTTNYCIHNCIHFVQVCVQLSTSVWHVTFWICLETNKGFEWHEA